MRGRKKNLEQTQRRLCVLVTGSAKRFFSWKTARDWLEGEGGAEGGFGGFGRDVNSSFREKTAKAGLRHCGNTTGHSLARLHSGHKEGISSFIYAISCHVDPEMAPVPSSEPPCLSLWLAIPVLSPKRQTDP